MRKSSVPLLRLGPYGEEPRCEVPVTRRFQVEHSSTQGIAEVPSLIHKPLWGVRMSIDYKGIRMDFRRIIYRQENSSPR
jgi:hypothetical protein